MVVQKTFCQNQEVLHLVTSTGLKTNKQQNSRPALDHKLMNEVYNCFANYTIKGLSYLTVCTQVLSEWEKNLKQE